MIDVALLLLVAAGAFAIRRILHVPLIPILLLAGMGIRYADLGLDEHVARAALDIGLAVLVFGAGMELNPKRFGEQYRLVFGVGLAQFAFIGLGGALLSRWLGFGWLPSLYVGLAISTSSTLIIIRLLKARQQMFEPFGRLVTGVLLLQDLLIILMIVILSSIPDGGVAVLRGAGGLAFMLVLSYAGLRKAMPYLLLRMKLDQETLGLVVLVVLFVFMGLAHLMNLPIITGAFLAGVSLSSFPVNSVARGVISSVTAFFMAMFFVVLGGLIDFPSASEWLWAGVVTGWIVVATPLIVMMVAIRMRMNARSAIESGLLLAMTSEFSLVVVLQGLLSEQIPAEVFNVVALVTVLTMTVTPLLATDRLTWYLMHLLPGTAPRELDNASELRDHIVMLGYGKGSSVVFKALKKAGNEVVIVNDDPIVVRDLVEQGIRAVYGEGSDARVLDVVHAGRARLIISSMRRVSDAENVMKRLGPHGPPLIIRVFEPIDAARIRAMGGIPVMSSEAAADAFMKWHQQVFGEGEAVHVED